LNSPVPEDFRLLLQALRDDARLGVAQIERAR
jgi:hypothetical protein